jgi:AcrR family transcriptional regulator
MEEATAQSRRLRKKNKTHNSILHSAKKLFEEKGIGNVSIEKISEAADVSRSTFFIHFSSLDDLLEQIAAEEINDLFSVAKESDRAMTIRSLMFQLIDDTVPYPYLTGELLMRGMLSKTNNSFEQVDKFLQTTIEEHEGYKSIKEQFSSKEISSILLGVYFGIIFQRFINKENFESNRDSMKDTMNKFITFTKNN